MSDEMFKANGKLVKTSSAAALRTLSFLVFNITRRCSVNLKFHSASNEI